VAFALRAANIGAGLPYSLGVDEPEIMERVFRMMKTGNFNPNFFDWPSLTMYLQLVVACLAFLSGAMHGAWRSLSDIGASDLAIYGRTLTAVIGTATVGVLFLAARRWGVRTGLFAAALLAVAPNHVRESHFVLADIPTTFFTTLTFLLALRAHEGPSLAAFALAGAATGLAASCKYNGLIAIVLPLTAAVAARAPLRTVVARVLVIFAATAAAFLVGTPYAVLALPKFLADYARLAYGFARTRGGEAGWSLYLKYVLQSFGWAGVAAAVVGLCVAIGTMWRGPGRLRSLLIVLFLLLYFKVMATSFQIYGRYTLPLLPFVALLAAIGTAWAVRLLRMRLPFQARTATVAGLLIAVAAPPLVRSVAFDRMLGRPSTTDLAYQYIEKHIAPGATIAVETYPILLTTRKYRVKNVRPLTGRTYADYMASGVNYVLVSAAGYRPAYAAPDQNRPAYDAYVSLFAQARELASFAGSETVPGPDLRLLVLQPTGADTAPSAAATGPADPPAP
jgi:4-amino-4-deoxy-L-arabinose transferase-like glycosyltransferase